MKRGDSVIILQNSGPWDKEDFYGRVGEVSHTDYGLVAVAIDGKMVLCEPENVIMVSAVPLLLEALERIINNGYLDDVPTSIRIEAERAVYAAKGTDDNQ